jgi:predicted MPP superfamily phosphohydrolase
MYVTAGIGTSIVPVRFLNPPEIVLITLRGREMGG